MDIEQGPHECQSRTLSGQYEGKVQLVFNRPWERTAWLAYQFSICSCEGIQAPSVEKSMRIPTGMKKVVLSNRSAVDEMVNRIQGLPESEITRAIDTVPKQLALTKRKKEFLRRLLQYRQKCIDLIMLDILDQIKQNKPGLL